ncbi:DUF928 domain-containing protein [Nostoc sp. FACHB-110]|uniref:DUF928 domain-containing protein n=1 Tax=Nostoc sp. FACHB-110 TaxID=2692834 RepID=UPI0016891ADE|nr:DUF928 domain-containing protein [Nostoc sp. FACHB-110]MBD2436781.1 DUF928 domain-containing protein [Nostoc sp. FACHB-110]
MFSLKSQTISFTVIATIGLTSILSITTAVAKQEIIFIPPTLNGPQRLIPAGTRVYEPPSGLFGGNSELRPVPALPSPVSPVRPADEVQNDTRVVIPKTIPTADQCLQGQLPLTALIPESQLGLTTVADPTLLFYLPQTSAPELELTVQNANEQEVYKQKYKPSNKSGIISLRLPVNTLAVNQQYKWKFSVICNPANQSQNKFVAGVIQRILPNPELARKLPKVTKQERVALYAAAGLWHDTIATLAQIRYLTPNNPEIVSAWTGLITGQGVGLNPQIAQQPLIPPLEIINPDSRNIQNKKSLKF